LKSEGAQNGMMKALHLTCKAKSRAHRAS